MFQFLKDKVFGSKIMQRTNSVNINSKHRRHDPEKKVLSIDSKQKQQKDLQVKKKLEIPQILSFDQSHCKQNPSNSLFHQSIENIDDIRVSDGGSSSNQRYENLLQGLDEQTEELISNEPKTNIKGKQIIPNCIKQTSSSIMFQTTAKHQKILMKREASKKIIKKIQEKCSICKSILKYSDSIQLACTHRCHKICVAKMQLRNQYKCDLCQLRNEKTSSSIYN